MPGWWKRIPGGLMIVPLLFGAILSTIDHAHLPVIQNILRWLGASPVADANGIEVYEYLQIGGFATALTGIGAPTLIAMFLVCVSAQVDFRVRRRAIKKGANRHSFHREGADRDLGNRHGYSMSDHYFLRLHQANATRDSFPRYYATTATQYVMECSSPKVLRLSADVGLSDKDKVDDCKVYVPPFCC